MKIVFISDTHGIHKQLDELCGDMIIHAGDVSKRGTYQEIKTFLKWFETLNFKHKIFIAGNHDFYLEHLNNLEVEEIIPKNVIYLNDSGIEIDNLKIWGSPIQPWFHNWAFNRDRGTEIKKHWDLIPDKTDLLITHGPPFNILDKIITGEHVGCLDLLKRVSEVKPSIHIFGHIHEDYGMKQQNGTQFINAAVLNQKYKMANPPIEFIL